MIRQKINVVGKITLMIAVLGSIGVDGQAMTLKEALQELANTHKGIESARLNIESARHEVERNKANYYPKVSANITAGVKLVDSIKTRMNKEDFKGDFYSGSFSGSLNISQTLYDWGVTGDTVKVARARVSVADHEYKFNRQTYALEGAHAWYTVLEKSKVVALAERSVELLEEILKSVTLAFESGSGTEVNVLEARLELSQAKDLLESHKGALSTAIIQYEQVFGQSPAIDTMKPYDVPVSLLPTSLEQAINLALSNNSELLLNSVMPEIYGSQRSLAYSQMLPKLDLIASAEYSTPEGEPSEGSFESNKRVDYKVYLDLSWDLFSGRSSVASALKAEKSRAAAEAQVEHAKRKVIEKVSVIWDNVQVYKKRYALMEGFLKTVQDLYTARRALYRNGTETQVSVLRAGKALVDVRIMAEAMRSGLHREKWSLMESMGLLHQLTDSSVTSG